MLQEYHPNKGELIYAVCCGGSISIFLKLQHLILSVQDVNLHIDEDVANAAPTNDR